MLITQWEMILLHYRTVQQTLPGGNVVVLPEVNKKKKKTAGVTAEAPIRDECLLVPFVSFLSAV